MDIFEDGCDCVLGSDRSSYIILTEQNNFNEECWICFSILGISTEQPLKNKQTISWLKYRAMTFYWCSLDNDTAAVQWVSIFPVEMQIVCIKADEPLDDSLISVWGCVPLFKKKVPADSWLWISLDVVLVFLNDRQLISPVAVPSTTIHVSDGGGINTIFRMIKKPHEHRT